MYARDSSVVKKYIRHCIKDNIKYGRYLFIGYSGKPDLVV